MGRRIVSAGVPFFLLIFLCGCDHKKSEKAFPTQPAQTKTPPFFQVGPVKQSMSTCTQSSREQLCLPGGNEPTGLFTTKSAAVVVKAAADAEYRSIYSWEPGKDPKLIVRGLNLDVTRLSDDGFAAWYSENRQEVLVTFDAQKLTSEPLVFPDGGPSGWQGCQGDAHYLACIGNRPGMKPEDKDFDEMAFTLVIVVDLEQRTASSFATGHNTHFFFNPVQKLIYVTDHTTTESERAGVAVFDPGGKRCGKAEVSDMALSPSGRFAETLQEDGAESWAIYDVKTQKTLLDFNCDRPGCIFADRSVRGGADWNPVDDDQVAVLGETGKAYGAGNTCNVYQVSTAQRVKSVPCDGMPVYDWSRDGREIVMVGYIGGKFARQKVN